MEHLNLKTKPNTEFNLDALYQICPDVGHEKWTSRIG